ncbi:MAG: hypothetical protein HQ596_05335 [Candidatus Saganbacteria bacterium]|nr:hypothetical protein [Candidatus Saganbacteria bacterium]
MKTDLLEYKKPSLINLSFDLSWGVNCDTGNTAVGDDCNPGASVGCINGVSASYRECQGGGAGSQGTDETTCDAGDSGGCWANGISASVQCLTGNTPA